MCLQKIRINLSWITRSLLRLTIQSKVQSFYCLHVHIISSFFQRKPNNLVHDVLFFFSVPWKSSRKPLWTFHRSSFQEEVREPVGQHSVLIRGLVDSVTPVTVVQWRSREIRREWEVVFVVSNGRGWSCVCMCLRSTVYTESPLWSVTTQGQAPLPFNGTKRPIITQVV